MSAKTQPIAYSYVRFSTPEQAKGDSLRRQTEATADWCKRNDVQLDTSITLHDLGKSAFTGAHRKNPDRNALAAFLKLVENGRVPKGSYLIVENLDRLTREHVRAAVALFLSILDQGVSIVTTKPERVFRHDSQDMTDIIIAVVDLSRGHGESARKSDLNGATWRKKISAAREKKDQPPRKLDGRVTRAITSRLPAWVEDRDGELCLIPERAAVVKRIFALAAHGYGVAATVKRLTQEGVKPFGRSGVWIRAYVAKILKDRRALGEHQPRGTGRKPDGEPIPGYFPAIVTEDEWLAARGGAQERTKFRGRVGEYLNIFAGLLYNARDGDSFIMSAYARSRGGHRILVNSAGTEARVKWESFRADVFERAILGALAEIDPHEILNGDHGPDESLSLAGQLAAVEGRIGEMEAELLKGGEVAALARVLRQLEEQKRKISSDLAEARQKAAHPLSESWGEAQTLLGTLDAAPDPEDARRRLRSALRRMVDSVWLLIVKRGRDRLAAVQIWFEGGRRRRDYLILHRPAHGSRHGSQEGSWRCWSLADVAAPGDLDLRKRAHAKRLEAALGQLDVDAIG